MHIWQAMTAHTMDLLSCRSIKCTCNTVNQEVSCSCCLTNGITSSHVLLVADRIQAVIHECAMASVVTLIVQVHHFVVCTSACAGLQCTALVHQEPLRIAVLHCSQDVALHADIWPHIWLQDMSKLQHLARQHGGQRPRHVLPQLLISILEDL